MSSENNENQDNTPTTVRRRRTISNETRQMIINHGKHGKKSSWIAGALGLPRTSVIGILKKYYKEEKTKAGQRGGDFSTKLSNEQKLAITSWVDEEASLTLNDLKLKVAEEFYINVGISTISRCLNEFHFSLKMHVTVVPEIRNSNLAIELRYNYATNYNSKMLSLEDKNLVFLDEVVFSVSSRTKKGRSLVGSSAYTSASTTGTQNISVIAAMNKYGMIDHFINRRLVNVKDFKEYLLRLKDECHEKDIMRPVFIMNNARIHHYIGLSEMIASGNLEFLYLPPYSPFLNPIENCFSKWKNLVVKCARNEEELLKHISYAFDEVTEGDCNGYYMRMLEYMRRFLERETICE